MSSPVFVHNSLILELSCANDTLCSRLSVSEVRPRCLVYLYVAEFL